MQWFVQPTGKPDVYIITAGGVPPVPDAPGFRRDLDRGPQDVLNARLPGEWRFIPVEGLDSVFQSAPFSAGPVYSTNQFQRVQPVNLLIGVEELLGTAEDKVNSFSLLIRMTHPSVSMQVVIKSLPIGVPDDEKPAWNFTPVN